MSSRDKLQQLTRYTDSDTIQRAVADAKRGRREGRLQLTAAMAWAAFACPDACPAICDAIASAWLGRGPIPEVPRGLPEAPIEATFWETFWATVDGPEEGYDAISITVAVAALGDALHEDFGTLAEQHALNHPGAAAAQRNPIPGYTDMSPLATCPEDSLGYALHRLILDNGYDPEVLKRDDIGLQELPRALHYLNARILQMHEVWHLVAGYETTSSGEIAISGFQLAQFGHNYSSMFLAVGMAIGAFKEPHGFNVAMQIISEGLEHGRNSPCMMDINWEDEWNSSLEDIRAKYNIPRYKSVFPQDIIETATEAPLWRRVLPILRLLHFNLCLRRNALHIETQLVMQ
ncbi:Coq4 family protein [Candidatus Marimicrobium litorale]|uniref:Uncharacterized protein n=1 Tax=Candidatus Marimicrobium litorale TaxID=2518991 RepID=A0ABT3T965_9GAMM|nr:Coq4 family protein [Candidatus Marimicrobium litorale]MCX2978589.1 hypothetical protein [Candidatus Marimicrobium litorale]